MERSNIGWIIGGIVVLILIIGGMWWLAGSNAGTSQSTVASSTLPDASSTAQDVSTTDAQPVAVASGTGGSVVSVLGGIPDASIAANLFNQSGVASMVSGKGPYTLFVPDNEAFSAVPPGTLSTLTAAQFKRLVEYHVIVGRALNVDAVSSGSVQALSKDPLNFQVNLQNGTANVGSAYVLREYKAQNGVVYLISAVLIPPQKSNL